jgi:hypothetical protein
MGAKRYDTDWTTCASSIVAQVIVPQSAKLISNAGNMSFPRPAERSPALH